jgi:FixJ family two-component response regulator
MVDRPFIAVVDDDSSVRKAIERLLRTARMQVASYSSAAKFLVALEQDEPDCLVLDIRMPGMTGLELRDRLATLGRHIPIVFITAHAEDLTGERGTSGEKVEILNKPFGDAVLLEAIGRSIRNGK